jgi:nucleoside-diphosphate-sugar epimerase
MRVFVAGGSGTIGRRLVPQLARAGHDVVASTRSPEKAEMLTRLGARAVVLEMLDQRAVLQTIEAAEPEVVIHQLTALQGVRSLRNFDKSFAGTNRLRTEGLDYLLAAAHAVGARRLIAQSYTGWPNIRAGGRIKTEEDPLDPHPPASMTRTLAALRYVEETVSRADGVEGVVLRYGSFYGYGTSLGQGGEHSACLRSDAFRSWATGAGFGHSSTSTMLQPRP